MPITDQFQRLPLSAITVRRDERQRKVIDTSDIEPSIKARGVLQPIIVRSEGELAVLVAGERRLVASQKLGLPDIPVRWASDLSPIEARIFELEENIKRRDLEWQDQAQAVAEIHELYRQIDPEWTMAETGAELSLGKSMVSVYLQLWRERDVKGVMEAGTYREAHNIIQRREARAAGDALQELLELPVPVPVVDAETRITGPVETRTFTEVKQPSGLVRLVPKPLPESILCTSFLEWAPLYTGPKFSLVHCDFPYGIGVFDSEQGLGSEGTVPYEDTEELYLKLLECFCKHLDRFMSVSAHLMFWYSARPGSKREAVTREIFAKRAPSLDFEQFPLVWVKSDNAGIAGDARRMPRHVYETCLLASRGRRQIVKIAGDAYSAPTDKRLHASTKPEPVLRHFMQMFVDENTTLFDPTCGSGAALRAAESLGAKWTLGLEIDPKCCELARQALRNSRALRAASKEL